MTGNLRVPWRPRIDLEGQTTFTFKDFGGDRGCLITAYQEEWGLSAGEAVMQLVTCQGQPIHRQRAGCGDSCGGHWHRGYPTR